ncbi:hypothetical protein FNW02_07945 [Komarekiella sp. 'clone 1']|uniref:Uncharacterized protein n=1 Tax=Komarekiella delphini-convector SJRDD-AB1 TaxID=2593771 RepID=A0AA40VPY2_9NOST|nr:hypothetical protein [Komarekiella delphini-convector]MBD6615764.1 hypothetical protein [Komarekiella delphini-convector SJRDD-AB1]
MVSAAVASLACGTLCERAPCNSPALRESKLRESCLRHALRTSVTPVRVWRAGGITWTACRQQSMCGAHLQDGTKQETGWVFVAGNMGQGTGNREQA